MEFSRFLDHTDFQGTTIENLRRQFGEDTNFITFGKFVTSLVQQLKKKCELTASQFIHIIS